MNDQATPAPEPAGDGGPGPAPELTEAERELLEQQMKEIRVEDLLAQTVASVINLTARRLLKEDEIDLEQARTGIDAVGALVGLLPEEVRAAIREPLSQLQLLYAQKSGGPAAGEAGGEDGLASGPGTGAGPAGTGESGLWVPGR